jgi:carboxymethylenebutenolidase
MFEASRLQYNITSGYIQIVSNGHYLPAFWAHPELGGPFPGLVMLHDQWGLTPHIRIQARRFAEQGYYVIAPDLFNRQIATSVEQAQALIAQVGDAVLSHVAATLHALTTHHKCNSKIGLIGWGMGGQLALRTATARTDLQGLVTFYNPLGDVMLAELRALDCSLMAVLAGADPATPPEIVQRLRQALSGTGVTHEVVEFPAAGYGFFDDTSPAFDAELAADAWKRALAFLNAQLDVPPVKPPPPGTFDPGTVY